MGDIYTKEKIQSLTEDQLRTQIVVPLFREMGFTVYDTHGALEFGKDLVVYSRDNTGELVYSAVQIKTKDIHGNISRPANIRTIIQQCESAFQIPFPDAFGPVERRIEKVYVVTSRKITPAAEKIIFNSVRNHGPVKFMDIDRLIAHATKLLSPRGGEAAEEIEAIEDEREIIKPETLPRITRSTTRRIVTGCGALYVTYSTGQQASPLVISYLTKGGGCATALHEAIASMVSLSFQKGASIQEVVERLRGIRCPSVAWEEGRAVLSCPDAIAVVLEEGMQKS